MLTFFLMACDFRRLDKTDPTTRSVVTGGPMYQFGRDILENLIPSTAWGIGAILDIGKDWRD
jgi:hypothetical protein